MVLPAAAFGRDDESSDDEFYRQPRLVTHIDDAAIAAVTALYRQHLPPGGAVLDLMSSWVSHLPPEISYRRVVAVGMNAAELAANPRATEWRVQDLNRDPTLLDADATYDGAVCCVSVQYLTNPVAVFREAARVLKPGAPFVVTFSNRCFPTKAVAAWRSLDDSGHLALVRHYFTTAGAFTDIEARDASPDPSPPGRRGWPGDPLYAVIGRAVAPGADHTTGPGAPTA